MRRDLMGSVSPRALLYTSSLVLVLRAAVYVRKLTMLERLELRESGCYPALTHGVFRGDTAAALAFATSYRKAVRLARHWAADVYSAN